MVLKTRPLIIRDFKTWRGSEKVKRVKNKMHVRSAAHSAVMYINARTKEKKGGNQ